MKLNLRALNYKDGETLPFRYELDVSGLSLGYQKPCSEPLVVSGRVRNRSGTLILEALLETTLYPVCDRCALRYELPFSHELSVTLVHRLDNDEDNDGLFVMTGDTLETDEVVVPAFVLEFPIGFLCKESCAGLCHTCGQDLNEGSCSCSDCGI